MVMNQIDNENHQKTIFIIAHRFSTLKNCDRIYRVCEDGEIKPIDYRKLSTELYK